jgi:transposase
VNTPAASPGAKAQSPRPATPTPRRLLIEAAWHHKDRYTVGPVMRARWEQATPAARVRGHAGNQRLHHQWNNYTARKKKHTVANTAANTAIARELAGWCWSLATLEQQE